jgi:hypothetical protein
MKEGSLEYELSDYVAFIDTIDKLGDDGWEAVDSSSHFGFVQYILKRPKKEVITFGEKHSTLQLSPELAHELDERVNELREKILESYSKSE